MWRRWTASEHRYRSKSGFSASWDCFNDTDSRVGGDHAGGLKVSFFEESAVLGFGALLPWGRCKHGHVEHLARVEGIALGQYHFDAGDGGELLRGPVAVGEMVGEAQLGGCADKKWSA
jgi:hypothetical protein